MMELEPGGRSPLRQRDELIRDIERAIDRHYPGGMAGVHRRESWVTGRRAVGTPTRAPVRIAMIGVTIMKRMATEQRAEA